MKYHNFNIEIHESVFTGNLHHITIDDVLNRDIDTRICFYLLLFGTSSKRSNFFFFGERRYMGKVIRFYA